MDKRYNEYKMNYAKGHYKRVPLDLTLSEYEEWKQAAGETPLNTFIKNCVREHIQTIPPVGENDGGTV